MNTHSEYQYQGGQEDYWLHFMADDRVIDITLQQSANNPQAMIEEIVLFEGSCSNLNVLKSIIINKDSTLHFDKLDIGEDYHILVRNPNGNDNYFAIYLSVPCYYNVSLSCPHPYCDLVSNGNFNTIGNCLANDIANGNTSSPLYLDPLNLTVTAPSVQYDHVCGWAKSSSSPLIVSSNGNYYMHAQGYNSNSNGSWQEIFHTRLNDGNPITPGKYTLQFKLKMLPNYNYLDKLQIYLSSVENTVSGTKVLIANASANNTNWITYTFSINYTQTMANQGLKYLHFVPKGLYPVIYSNPQPVMINIDDVKFINFGLTSTTPTEICEGDPVNIIANSCPINDNYNVNYTWTANPTDPTMIVSGQNLNANPTQTTTYTCNMTTNTGINVSQSMTINVLAKPAAPTLTINSFTTCNSDQKYFITNYSSSNTYSYTIDIVGQNQYNYSIPANQTYVHIDWSNYSLTPTHRANVTVISTASNGCSNEYSFEIFDCCSHPNSDYNWNDISFANSNATYNNKIISINGILTLDGYSLTLKGCDIYMGGNAKINTINGGQLYLSNCDIEACDQKNMWDGLYSNSTSTKISSSSYTNIYDAKNTFVSNNGGRIRITQTNIERFYRGVTTNPHYSANPISYVSDNNTFIGSTLALYPFNGHNSACGYYAKDVIVSNTAYYLNLGHPNSNMVANTFSNIDTAIYTENCDFKMMNNRINNSNLLGVKLIGNSNSATTARRIVVGGTASGEKNIFTNNRAFQFVSTLKSNLHIVGNDFATNISNYNGMAIFVNNNIKGSISITNNNFQYSVPIMSLYITNNAAHINVNYNTFNYTQQGNSQHITISNNTNTSGFTAYTNVNHNTLSNALKGIVLSTTSTTNCKYNTLTNVKQGIYISNPALVHCDNNTYNNSSVTPSTAYPYFGISINNSYTPNSTINGNYIATSNYSPSASHTSTVVGVFVETMLNYEIRNNTILRFASGFRFKNENDNEIACNSWINCYYGVSLDRARIGEYKNNYYYIGYKFGGTTRSYDNEWYNNISTYRVYGMAMPITFPPNTLIADYYWLHDAGSSYSPYNIQDHNMQATLANTSAFYCGPPIPPPAAPIINNAAYQTQLLDNKRKSLFGNSIQALNASLLASNSQANALSNNYTYNRIKSIYFGLKQNPQLISLGTAGDALYQNFINTYSSSSIGQLYNIYYGINNNDSIMAANSLSSYSPSNIFGLVAHNVMEIYIKTQKDKAYILTSQDSSVLMNYAYMNTLQGGNEVYIARNLLGLYIVDMPKAKRMAKGEDEGGNSPDNNNIKLYPNPTKAILNIELNTGSLGIKSISIYNLLGQKVMQKYAGNTPNLRLDISKLKQGTYLIEIIDENDTSNMKKFVVK